MAAHLQERSAAISASVTESNAPAPAIELRSQFIDLKPIVFVLSKLDKERRRDRSIRQQPRKYNQRVALA